MRVPDMALWEGEPGSSPARRERMISTHSSSRALRSGLDGQRSPVMCSFDASPVPSAAAAVTIQSVVRTFVGSYVIAAGRGGVGAKADGFRRDIGHHARFRGPARDHPLDRATAPHFSVVICGCGQGVRPLANGTR